MDIPAHVSDLRSSQRPDPKLPNVTSLASLSRIVVPTHPFRHGPKSVTIRSRSAPAPPPALRMTRRRTSGLSGHTQPHTRPTPSSANFRQRSLSQPLVSARSRQPYRPPAPYPTASASSSSSSAPKPPTPSFTPTKAEIGRLRREMSADKRALQTQYPVAPSPVKFTLSSSPAISEALSPIQAVHARPANPFSPLAADRIAALETDLAVTQRELEAERMHAKELSDQLTQVRVAMTTAQQELKEEKTRNEQMRKRLEARAEQAVADREQLRSRAAELAAELEHKDRAVKEAESTLEAERAKWRDERQQLQQQIRTASPQALSSIEVNRLNGIQGKPQRFLVDFQASPKRSTFALLGALSPDSDASSVQESLLLSHSKLYPQPKIRPSAEELEEAACTERKGAKVRWSAAVDYKDAPSPMWSSPTSSSCSPRVLEGSPQNLIPPTPPKGSPSAGDDDVQDLRDMFNEYDTEGNGWLSADVVLMAYRGMERSFGLAEGALNLGNPSRAIAFEEFRTIMSALTSRLVLEAPYLST